MSRPVVIRRAARAEFDDAANWYEQRRAGLGAAFTAAVRGLLGGIAGQPDFYPRGLGRRAGSVSGGVSVLRLLP